MPTTQGGSIPACHQLHQLLKMSAFFHAKIGLEVRPRGQDKQTSFGDTLQELTRPLVDQSPSGSCPSVGVRFWRRPGAAIVVLLCCSSLYLLDEYTRAAGCRTNYGGSIPGTASKGVKSESDSYTNKNKSVSSLLYATHFMNIWSYE